VSCNTKEQVETAVKNGADYVGIGAVWGTLTKVLTSPVVGVRGIGEMLKSLDGSIVQAVAIGMPKHFPSNSHKTDLQQPYRRYQMH
jgi:thiamine-phosphate diphosphorylase/hydroxyethylthiazole kinase